MLIDIAYLAVGGALLYFGAEWLIKGAAGLARERGVRPLLVGLTVVAYGTSSPELVVSTVAALQGKSAISLGNVIGSNIANLALILGATAAISPLAVESRLVRRELPVMVATALLLPILLLNQKLGRLDAALLLVSAALFTWMASRPGLPAQIEEAEMMEHDAEEAGAPRVRGRGSLAVLALAGLLVLLCGGRVFVQGASALALALGMSERMVGLTIVAVGTSLPELAACLVAALRGHASIAVGNIVGSNIFNVLFVLGATAAISPVSVSLRAAAVDLAVMIVLSGVAFFMLWSHRRVSRTEGIVLMCSYVAFLTYLLIDAL